MSFDLKAARKHADADGLMGTTKWLYAALDEIERQANRMEALILERAKALPAAPGCYRYGRNKR